MDDAHASQAPVRLTSLAHGGGCGCKIAPAVLQQILAEMPAAAPFANLLVGTESADDAAVWKLNDEQALVATTDFFMPVVDDPFDFGRIAATNALSDVYAMGGTPILALALVGMPVNRLPVETIRAILAGGQAVCAAAGIPVAGGHSIDSLEPIYGLVALGLVHPGRVQTNRTAQAGDVLILGKALGVGILSAAFKQERLNAAGYAALIASTTQLNSVGPELAARAGVHAMTDVTGFGLLGHLGNMLAASKVGADIWFESLPILPHALSLAGRGIVPGGSQRNLAAAEQVDWADDLTPTERIICVDAQTSGGLLLAVPPENEQRLLAALKQAETPAAAVIGRLTEGPAGRVRVTRRPTE